MTDQDIVAGDTVKHRAGGPPMRVAAVNGFLIDCEWFTKDDEYRCMSFTTEAVSPYEAVLMTLDGPVRISRATDEQRREAHRLMIGGPRP